MKKKPLLTPVNISVLTTVLIACVLRISLRNSSPDFVDDILLPTFHAGFGAAVFSVGGYGLAIYKKFHHDGKLRSWVAYNAVYAILCMEMVFVLSAVGPLIFVLSALLWGWYGGAMIGIIVLAIAGTKFGRFWINDVLLFALLKDDGEPQDG